MISHELQCIFIHIPKNAGSSIERALGHYDANGSTLPDHRSIRMLERPLGWRAVASAESRLELLLRCRHALTPQGNPNNALTVSSAQYARYFKFTIVRNPWARAFSWYSNCMTDARHLKRLGLRGPVSLDQFLRGHAGKGALRTQLSWLRDFRGDIPMNYVARFESLAADFDNICRTIGAEAIPLPHARKGAGKNYRAHYNDTTIRIVADVYAEEIDLFGYSFDE